MGNERVLIMNHIKEWHNTTIGERTVKALQKNKFGAIYCANKQEAIDYILDQIPEGSRIGVGGSSTLRELGLIAMLEEKKFVLYDHNAPGLKPEEKTAQRYNQLTSDIFLSSTNAITLKGELMNKDGIGNRVAAMTFGPKKVIIVAGINKVVQNLEEAEQRIRMKAAPLNTKRHELPNPCLQTGQCADCHTDNRICNITTIIHRCPPLTSIEVVLIGEELGY